MASNWQFKWAAWETGGVLAYTSYTIDTNAIRFSIEHEFNKPATMKVYIVDDDAYTAYQRYFDDGVAPGIFVIAGKVLLQSPIPSPDDDVSNIIFDGRITNIEFSGWDNMIIITCEDWSSQLGNRRINYDMREDLDGAGLVQSETHTDNDNATYIGPVYTNGANYYMYDDDMSWDDDEWNGKYLVFTGGMAGDITVKVGPYQDAVDGDGNDRSETNTYVNTWDDDTNYHLIYETKQAANPADDFWITYDFRVNATEGSLYSSGPSDMQVNIVYDFIGQDVAEMAQARIYAYDHTGATYRKIGDMGLAKHENVIQRKSFKIPERFLSTIVGADGIAHIRIYIEVPVNMYTGIYVYFVELETHLTTVGTNSAFLISDTDDGGGVNDRNRIKVDTDLDITGLGIWETCPYSIIDKIMNHINGLVTTYDEMVAMTTSVDTTTGLSTARFVERTPLEILTALADADQAKWWVVLGTKQLKYEEGFDAAAVATWTDATVLAWDARLDMEGKYNQYHIYGFGDIYRTSADIVPMPGTTTQTEMNCVRSDVFRSNRIMSQYEADQLASALVYMHEKFLYPTIKGYVDGLYTTGTLGDKILVNSTRLGMNANHSIIKWMYDSDSNITTVYLHCTSSTGLNEIVEWGYKIQKSQQAVQKMEAEQTLTDLSA